MCVCVEWGGGVYCSWEVKRIRLKPCGPRTLTTYLETYDRLRTIREACKARVEKSNIFDMQMSMRKVIATSSFLLLFCFEKGEAGDALHDIWHEASEGQIDKSTRTTEFIVCRLHI